MQNFNLQYQFIFPSNHQQPNSFKIIFNDTFFARAIKLISLPNFPKSCLLSYSYEYHQKYIEFCYIGDTYTKEAVIKFANQICSDLDKIKIATFHNSEQYKSNKYSKILAILDSTCCLCYKIIKKKVDKFKEGDIIVYYMEDDIEGIQKFSDFVLGFIEEIVDISISGIIEKFSIPEDLVESVFQNIINCYCEEFESIASLKELQIHKMEIVHQLNNSEEKEWSVSFFISGPSKNIDSFIDQIDYALKTIPILMLKFEEIRTFKLTQISENFPLEKNNTLLNENTLLILDRAVTNKKFCQLQTGEYFLGPETFTENERLVLQKYFRSENLEIEFEKEFVECENCELFNEFVILKCMHKDVQKIIEVIKKYAEMFILEVVPVHEFPNKMIAKTFYNHFKSKIPLATFKFIDEILYRENFTKETTEIVNQIAQVGQQIATKICQVPSLSPISKQLSNAKNFVGLYIVEKNPENMWEKSLKSAKYRLAKKCEIILTDLSNLVHYEEQVILLIHNETPSNSIIFKICSEHKINLEEFIEGANKNDERICRINKFTDFISFKFKQIVILFCNVSELNYRHLKEDISNCFQYSSKLKRINFILSQESKKFNEEIVPLILNKCSTMEKASQIRASEIFFYAEKLSELSHLERTILKSNIEIDLLTKEYFNEWSFLKMNNLKEFILSYLWVNETLTLPGIDSYLFWLQEDKSSSKKALLTLPGHEYTQKKYKQFVVCFKEKIVYEIDGLCVIKTHPIEKMSEDFKTLASIVWKEKFIAINYFVIYGISSDNIIAKEVCLNLFYKNEKVPKLIPLSFNLKERTVSINKKMHEVHYAMTRRTHVDWYKFYLHQDLIQTFENCLEK